MKLSKAIEILDDIVECGEYEGDPYDSVAVKLGIEALKRIKQDRIVNDDLNPYSLPGETE